MSAHKHTVELYIDGFNRSDHAQILSCLSDDVEWVMPGAFHVTGKEAFDREIEKGGGVLEAVFCDAFEMEGGKIKRLISYLVMLTQQPSGSG
jgi:ketosteroid isomerase-like protein